ncbi:hypothetical protein [Bacillus thuringiensis]|uniref:hypothetical protein n=1 Tax=Bacillus thuringiensis TaxID=1428 RepID=UPI0021B183E8|nr:hypothetical protein [Bacillus thuringiensis]
MKIQKDLFKKVFLYFLKGYKFDFREFQNETTLPEITTQITSEHSVSSSSKIDSLHNIVDNLSLENDEEEEYINQISHLFYQSVVEKLKDRKIFNSKQQFF